MKLDYRDFKIGLCAVDHSPRVTGEEKNIVVKYFLEDIAELPMNMISQIHARWMMEELNEVFNEETLSERWIEEMGDLLGLLMIVAPNYEEPEEVFKAFGSHLRNDAPTCFAIVGFGLITRGEAIFKCMVDRASKSRLIFKALKKVFKKNRKALLSTISEIAISIFVN